VINTLSSQHEGMLFRVMIQVSSLTSEVEEVFSSPIRVVSKPSKNKRAEIESQEETETLQVKKKRREP